MKSYLVGFLLLLPTLSWASTQDAVKIQQINVNRELGQVFIQTTIPASPAGCHTDTHWNYTFLLTNEADNAMYSTLLSAKIAGKTLSLVGFAACPSTGYGAVEELRWATIID